MKYNVPNSCGALAVILILLCNALTAQLSLPASGLSETIDFSASIADVNNGEYDAMFAPVPVPDDGDLDADAWEFAGFNSAADLMQGDDVDGGVGTGGIYAFSVGGDVFLGVQPGGSDFTPGTFILNVTNNTGQALNEIELSFESWVNNDQPRSNTLEYAVSSNGTDFQLLGTITSVEVEDNLGFVGSGISESIMLTTPLAVGANLIVRWTGNDNSGSGARDEFGIDDISIRAPELSALACTGSAGPNQVIAENATATMDAQAEVQGIWSADFGSFSSATDPMAVYTPGSIENDTTVILTWTSMSGMSMCAETEYTTMVTIIAEVNAGFSYDPAILCPRDGAGIIQLDDDAILGALTYVANTGGPFLDIDLNTGNINAGNSDEGDYTITNSVTGCGNLIITGVIDGTLPGAQPKVVELYALTDIADLSSYNLEVVNNGNGTSNNGLALPNVSLSGGDYYHVTGSTTAFLEFFGFAPDLEDNEIDLNGDDAVVLKCNGTITDVFGDPDLDGTGTPWVYANGWAYRNNDQVSNYGSFDPTNWMFSGVGALDGETTNDGAANPMPISTNSNAMPPPNTDVSATFDVSIDFDADPGISLACKGQLNTAIDPATCFANISYTVMLQNVDPIACFNYGIEIEGLPGNLISEPGTYKVSVVSGYDGNSCWGMVTVEDKTAPILTCPLDATIDCALDPSPENVRLFGMTDVMTDALSSLDFPAGPGNAAAWGVGVQECGEFALNFQDFLRDGGCDGDTIIRTFTAIDATNRVTSCSHVVFLAPEDLMDITLPPDYDCTELSLTECPDRVEAYGTASRTFALSCDGEGSEWAVLPNGNPSPDDSLDIAGNVIAPGTGRIGGLNCGNVQAGFIDIRVPLCTDLDAECSQAAPSFKVVRQWKVLDWCSGDIVEHNQIIKVIDDEAPIAETLPDVTISTDLWTCTATYTLPSGTATDNCSTEIHREYRSSTGEIMDGVLFVADNAKTMNGAAIIVEVDFIDCCGNTASESFRLFIEDQVPPVPVADHHTTVSLSQFEAEGLAKIFAESFDDGSFDNCGPIDMQVRRTQASATCVGYEEQDDENAYNDFVHFCCEDVGELIMVEFRVCDDADMDGNFATAGDNCNFAMIEVEVQDKLPPVCSAPADRTIDCIDLAALGDLSTLTGEKIDSMFGPAAGAATCLVDVTQVLTSSEECGLGSITRTITATNSANGLFSDCIQIITVEVDSNVNFLTCTDISFSAESEEGMVFAVAGISNVWCETNPLNIGDPVEEGADLPAIQVMDCEGAEISSPIINTDNLCSEVGINLSLDTFDFAGGGCKKILAHWEIIDQCLFDENFFIDDEINPFRPENGYFELYVEYDLFDTEGPTIMCGEGYTASCDGSLSTTLSASASDNCTSEEFFGWTWKFDLGADGSIEHEGEGNEIEPEDIGMMTFPNGEHMVTWIVSDGCGNTTHMECPLGFSIEDTKAPTPYCYDGLSTAFMEVGGVTLWAADFDAGSFDNCGEVFVTMVPETDVEGLSDAAAYGASFKLVLNPLTGKQEYGWTFDCTYIPNGSTSTIDVRLYATDEAGNFDYCTASLRLQDNQGACSDSDGALAVIGGNIQTVSGDMVSGVEVHFTNTPEMAVTNSDGDYEKSGNAMGYDYSITPLKNDDFRNGVSTLDIVLIQKHILDITKLDNPYSLIAADVNKDSSIKATDLLQLRKLILGLYPGNALPNNTSWRFLDKNTTFANEAQPWIFNESIDLYNLSSDMMNQDFMAVKVGDVNGTAEVSEGMKAVSRTESNFVFDIKDRVVEKGEVVNVAFTAAEINDLYGVQLSLEITEGLEYAGYEPGILDLSDANIAATEEALSISYDDVRGISFGEGEVLFTLSFYAVEMSTVGKSISLKPELLRPELYLGDDLVIHDIKLEYSGNEQLNENLKVLQNEPNPFRDRTAISFFLSEDTEVTLEVYNVAGTLLASKKGKYAKGMNTIHYTADGGNGVMYYRVTAGDDVITKKMIRLE